MVYDSWLLISIQNLRSSLLLPPAEKPQAEQFQLAQYMSKYDLLFMTITHNNMTKL